MPRYHSNISLKRSDYERVKKIAKALNCTMPEAVIKLVEYCEEHNCIEELRSRSATYNLKPKITTRSVISKDLIIDLRSFGKFTLTRNEWKLFENIILNTQSYLSKDVLKEFPSSKLKDLFNKLYKLGIIYHDIKTWSWKINYEKLFKRYVVL